VILINSVVTKSHSVDNATYTVRILYNLVASLNQLDFVFMWINRLFSEFYVPRLYY
jgi:hypothetical protein